MNERIPNPIADVLMKQFGQHLQHLSKVQDAQSQVVDVEKEEQECDHKGHYRAYGGAYCAIRMCVNCGKSWRIWTKPEYDDVPIAEWEPIKEGLEVEERVLPDYEE